MTAANLVREVRVRPLLWENGGTRHPGLRRVLWAEVCRSLGVSHVGAVQKRWKGLRDTFRKKYMKHETLRKRRPESNIENPAWRHYSPLMFLKDEVRQQGRRTTGDSKETRRESSIPPSDEHLSDESDMAHASSDMEESSESSSSKIIDTDNGAIDADELLKKIRRDLDEVRKEKAEILNAIEKDEDFLFFRSLLPYMRTLDASQKFNLRTKMLRFICNFVCDDRNAHAQI